MRDYYIDKIDYFREVLRVIRDNNESNLAITEYDSVYQDILDYQENNFEDFKDDSNFIEFLNYLKDLIISGLEYEV